MFPVRSTVSDKSSHRRLPEASGSGCEDLPNVRCLSSLLKCRTHFAAIISIAVVTSIGDVVSSQVRVESSLLLLQSLDLLRADHLPQALVITRPGGGGGEKLALCAESRWIMDRHAPVSPNRKRDRVYRMKYYRTRRSRALCLICVAARRNNSSNERR